MDFTGFRQFVRTANLEGRKTTCTEQRETDRQAAEKTKRIKKDEKDWEEREKGVVPKLRNKRCQHETVRKETILIYINIPDFFITCFSFKLFFYPYFYDPWTKWPWCNRDIKTTIVSQIRDKIIEDCILLGCFLQGSFHVCNVINDMRVIK